MTAIIRIAIAYLIVQGFYRPTVLQILHGPWIIERSLLSKN